MLEQRPFVAAAEEIAAHPFLREAANGTLPLSKWKRYMDARLETGPRFVQFLERLAAEAKKQGYDDITAAAEGNRNEELGIVDGEVRISRAHHEWRRWFREGMNGVLAARDLTLDAGPAADFTEVNGYPEAFDSLNDEGDVIRSMGALGVFELGLGYEYTEVLKGMDLVFPNELTPKQRVYLVGHAKHEARHFDEVFGPLAAVCTTRDHVARALDGAELAKRVKLGFLNGAYREPVLA